MRIGVKGRNFDVSEEVRQKVGKRFDKIGKQVSDLAHVDVELSEERNPAIRNSCVAEATLYLKGVTLRSRTSADNMSTAVADCADELSRQVKKHRDKRRGRRVSAGVHGQAAAP
jgi:putative sigma-54 modulation protein